MQLSTFIYNILLEKKHKSLKKSLKKLGGGVLTMILFPIDKTLNAICPAFCTCSLIVSAYFKNQHFYYLC